MADVVARAVLELTTDAAPAISAMKDVAKAATDLSATVVNAGKGFVTFGSEGKQAIDQVSKAAQTIVVDITRVNDLVKNFGGAQAKRSAEEYAIAIQNIGGVTKLTRQEQEQANDAVTAAIAKYKALGEQAPSSIVDLHKQLTKIPAAGKEAEGALSNFWGSVKTGAGLIGVAFSAQAVVDFGAHVFDVGSQIGDMAAKLGVGVEAAQRFKFAAEQSGATVEDVEKAIGTMNRTLSEGSKSTVQALDKAGLSFADIRQMKPEDAFRTIADAVGGIEDPMSRARVAQDLFGKGALALLPGMVEGYSKLGAGAAVMSAETVARLKEAQDAWKALGDEITAITGGFIASLMTTKTTPVNASMVAGYGAMSPNMMAVTPAKNISPADAEQGQHTKAATLDAKDYAKAIAEARAEILKLTPAQREEIDAGLKLGTTMADLGSRYQLSADAQTLYATVAEEAKEASKKAAEEELKHKQALAEVASSTVQVSDAIKEKIVRLHDANVSTEAIVQSLKDEHVTTTQVNGVLAEHNGLLKMQADSEKMYADGRKAIVAQQIQEVDAQMKKVGDLYLQSVADRRRLDDLDKSALVLKLDNIDQGERAELLSLEKRGVANTELYAKEKRDIEAYYQHLRDVALGTSNTIVERMHALGISTRDDLALATASADRDYKQMLASGKYTAAELQKAFDKAWSLKMADDWRTAWIGAFGEVSQGFSQIAQIAQGDTAAITKGIGTAFASMQQLLVGSESVQKGMTEGGVKGAADFIGGMASEIGAAVQIGKLIHDAFTTPEWQKAMGDVGKTWGVQISKGVADQIATSAASVSAQIAPGAPDNISKRASDTLLKASGFTTTQVAELLNLQGIIADTGGLNAKNLTDWETRAARLFDVIKLGGKAGADATKELDAVLGDFGKLAATQGGVWDAQFKTLISRAQDLGVNLENVDALIQGQVDHATKGFTTALGVTSSAIDKAKADQDTIAGLQAKLSDTQVTDLAKIADLKAKMVGADAVHAAAYEQQISDILRKEGDLAMDSSLVSQIDAASDDLKTQQKIIDATMLTSQAGANAVAGAIQGIIDHNVKAGMSYADAVKAAQPMIAGLKQQLDATGLTGGAAFDFINQELGIVTGAVSGPALTALEGYSDGVVGLSNAGLLTQDSFSGLEEQIGRTYDTLVAQGADGNAALVAMQGPLQSAWELEQKFGYKADDATQALIDQAEQAGIVGEDHKTATDQMIDGIKSVVTAIDNLTKAMTGPGGIVDHAKETAKGIKDNLGNLRFNVPVTFTPTGGIPTPGPTAGVNGLPPGWYIDSDGTARPPGGGDEENPFSFAVGTPQLDFSRFAPSGERAILHNDEAVVPRGGGHQLAGEIAASLSQLFGTKTSAQPAASTVQVFVDGALLLDTAETKLRSDAARRVRFRQTINT